MRYPSIEILRTVAITFMVLVHFVENLSGVVGFIPTGFAAPIFTFLSGVSYRLWLNSQIAKGKSDNEISKVSIRRGLFLFGTGFLFNIFVWLPEDTFNWDILTFIGFALMSLNVARKMPLPAVVLACGIVLGISPILRVYSSYSEYWTKGYFECDMSLTEVMLGFLVNGFFPIFPWIVFPVTGFSAASILFPESRREAGTLRNLVIIGMALMAASAASILAQSYVPATAQTVYLKGWTMFPASFEYVLGTLGFAMTGFLALHTWLDKNPAFTRENVVGRVASTFSKHSFTVYLLHHVTHLWPLWIYGMMQSGDDPTIYWGKAMDLYTSLPLGIAFLLVCYFVLRWMDKQAIPGIESLMRWICD
ncbi:MAG: heparan-alpha-glucosaminide N-acetyltransferase domain-containing protein [Planctomycetaceae bacterium]